MASPENEIRTKSCSKCGKEFACKPQGGCWCDNYNLSQNTLDHIRAEYENCLCEECLKGYQEKAN